MKFEQTPAQEQQARHFGLTFEMLDAGRESVYKEMKIYFEKYRSLLVHHGVADMQALIAKTERGEISIEDMQKVRAVGEKLRFMFDAGTMSFDMQEELKISETNQETVSDQRVQLSANEFLRTLSLAFGEGKDFQEAHNVCQQIDSIDMHDMTMLDLHQAGSDIQPSIKSTWHTFELHKNERNKDKVQSTSEFTQYLSSLSDPILKMYALHELAIELASKKKNIDKGIDVARTITSKALRDMTFSHIVCLQVVEGEIDAAFRTLDYISNSYEKSAGLHALAMHILSKEKNIERAIELANSVQNAWYKALIFTACAEMEVKKKGTSDFFAKALDEIDSMHDVPERIVEARQKLALACANSGAFERALAVVRTISDSTVYNNTMMEMGVIMRKKGEKEQAEKIMNLITDASTRSQGYLQLSHVMSSKSLDSEPYLREAYTVARKEKNHFFRARALTKLLYDTQVIGVIRKKIINDIEVAIFAIREKTLKYLVQKELVKACIAFSDFESAEQYTQEIDDVDERSNMKFEMLLGLLNNLHFENAIAHADLLEDDVLKDLAYSKIAQTYANEKQFDEASKLMTRIFDLSIKTRTAQEIALCAAQQGNPMVAHQYANMTDLSFRFGDVQEENSELELTRETLSEFEHASVAKIDRFLELHGVSSYEDLKERVAQGVLSIEVLKEIDMMRTHLGSEMNRQEREELTIESTEQKKEIKEAFISFAKNIEAFSQAVKLGSRTHLVTSLLNEVLVKCTDDATRLLLIDFCKAQLVFRSSMQLSQIKIWEHCLYRVHNSMEHQTKQDDVLMFDTKKMHDAEWVVYAYRNGLENKIRDYLLSKTTDTQLIKMVGKEMVSHDRVFAEELLTSVQLQCMKEIVNAKSIEHVKATLHMLLEVITIKKDAGFSFRDELHFFKKHLVTLLSSFSCDENSKTINEMILNCEKLYISVGAMHVQYDNIGEAEKVLKEFDPLFERVNGRIKAKAEYQKDADREFRNTEKFNLLYAIVLVKIKAGESVVKDIKTLKKYAIHSIENTDSNSQSSALSKWSSIIRLEKQCGESIGESVQIVREYMKKKSDFLVAEVCVAYPPLVLELIRIYQDLSKYDQQTKDKDKKVANSEKMKVVLTEIVRSYSLMDDLEKAQVYEKIYEEKFGASLDLPATRLARIRAGGERSLKSRTSDEEFRVLLSRDISTISRIVHKLHTQGEVVSYKELGVSLIS